MTTKIRSEYNMLSNQPVTEKKNGSCFQGEWNWLGKFWGPSITYFFFTTTLLECVKVNWGNPMYWNTGTKLKVKSSGRTVLKWLAFMCNFHTREREKNSCPFFSSTKEQNRWPITTYRFSFSFAWTLHLSVLWVLIGSCCRLPQLRLAIRWFIDLN